MLTELYAILDLSSPDSTLTLEFLNAHREEVKKQYKKLSRQYHPDKFTEKKEKEEKAEIFKKITHAYESLMDTEKTIAYLKSASLNLERAKRDLNEEKNNNITHISQQIGFLKNNSLFKKILIKFQISFYVTHEAFFSFKKELEQAALAYEVMTFKAIYQNHWVKNKILNFFKTSFLKGKEKLSDQDFLNQINNTHNGKNKDSNFVQSFNETKNIIKNDITALNSMIFALEKNILLANNLLKMENNISIISNDVVLYKAIKEEDRLTQIVKEQELKERSIFEEKCRKDDEERNQLLVKEDAINEGRSISSLMLECFKKIYNALYVGQTSFFKSKNCVFELTNKYANDNEIITDFINQHANTAPNSRTAKARELTLKYFRSFSSSLSLNSNRDLFSEIYLYSYEQSGMFKKSKVTQSAIYTTSSLRLFSEEIKNQYYQKSIFAEESDSCRSTKIFNALK